jgi:phosphate transport system substrate-binding protein
MRKAVLVVVVGILVLGFAYALLRGSPERPESIKVSGAWALYPMMVRWAEEYQKVHPNVKIDISAGGAGKGMADALSGLVDLGMVSRDIDASEVEKGAFAVRVAKDAVLPTFNKRNPVAPDVLRRGMRRQQFKDVFVSGTVTTWGEVVGRPEVSDKISVYVRSDSCGAAEVWAKYLDGKQEDLKGVGIYGDPGIAEAVSRDERGIGFNNLNFAFDDKTGEPLGDLLIIPIDLNENGVVDAGESFYTRKADVVAAIASGRYPSPPARDLFVVTKDKFQGPSRDFMKWILTDGQKFMLATGYIPLSKEIVDEQLRSL